jgi:hypothetical protein
MTKEVPLYLHRETDEIVIILNQDLPHADNNHYVVKPQSSPPETLEQVAEMWKRNELKQVPTQPTSALWPLNYPEQRPQREVPIK